MHKICLTLVSISMFLVACSRSEERTRGMVAANASAIREARKFQSLLAQTMTCPVELAGWTRSNDVEPLGKRFGTEDVQFWMRLVCRDDLSFVVVLQYDVDSGTWVSGHETGSLEIKYGHHTALQTLQIAASDDPVDVAARVVREQ